MTAESLLWTERHRPRALDEIAMSEDNRALISNALAEGEVPHLLLHGPAGTGKTSLAFVISELLDCKRRVFNASKDRGIDVVRGTLSTFVRGRFGHRWNLVILDEADYLTREAQTALRNFMEHHADTARFVLTANYPHKILDPIRSRCVEVEMARMSKRERARVLLTVLKAEGVAFDKETVLSYVDGFVDLRRMISAAQTSVLRSGENRTLGPMPRTAEEDGAAALQAALDGDYPRVRDISKRDGVDHAELLRSAFWSVPDDHPRAATLRFELAEAYDETPNVPDPVVHFLGTMAGIIKDA